MLALSPGLWFAQGQRPTIYGDGGQTRDFVCVEDVARANVAALFSARDGACNVTTGSTIDLLGLVDTLRHVMAVGLEPEHVAGRAEDIRHSCGDAARMHEWLGVKAEWSLAEGWRHLRGPRRAI